MSNDSSDPAERRRLAARIADAIPVGIGRGVGRLIPPGADPESIPLPEPTPIEAGPNARPPGWDRATLGD